MENAAPRFKGTAFLKSLFLSLGDRPFRQSLAGYFRMPRPANFLLNLATWPPVSIIRCTPVQAG